MVKITSIVILALLVVGCSRDRPRPQPPTPSPNPTETPLASPEPSVQVSPTPRTSPTPYLTPEVDLAPYLHEQGGKTIDITIQQGEDVGEILNRVDSQLEGPGKIVLRGDGDIRTQVVTSHDVDAMGGEYRCETKTLEGCWLARDNTKIEAFNGATIHEPTYTEGGVAITVFQSYAAAKNNYASARGVTVKGWRIRGRQEKTDGGMRQAVSFGNCIGCAAIQNDLSGIASIGIQCGGGAAEGHHAENCLIYRNKLRRFAAAATALVNVNGAIVAENDIRDPGRKHGEQGGTSAIDIESNNFDDCVKDIKIFNNKIGYGNGMVYGSGILGQNVYGTKCSGGLLIANNVIDGYEGIPVSNQTWALSNGLFFVGEWSDGLVVANTVIRALQTAANFNATKQLTLRDNHFISCGGGGNYAIMLRGSSINNNFINNLIVDDKGIGGSTEPSVWVDHTSHNNVFERTGPVYLVDEQGKQVKCTSVDGTVGGAGCQKAQ